MERTIFLCSLLIMLIIVALTLLILPIFYMDVPYSADKVGEFWAFTLDKRPTEEFPLEVLSVSCEKPSPGTLIFEITIRARERILSIYVFAHTLAYVNETKFPHEKYPAYDYERGLFPGEERTFGTVLKYTPIDANVSAGYSLLFHSVITVYWTLQRPVVSLLPPPLYALSVGGIPILIIILAANIPILQKILERVRIKGVESLLRWAMGICVIVLLISAFLPWMIIYSKIYEGRVDVHYKNFYDLLKTSDKYFFSPSGIITVTSFLLTLFVGVAPIEIEMREENLRGRVLLLRSLLFGALCIVSVASWIYEIERIRIEPIHPDYIAYHIEAAGPLLTMISGLLIIFFGYLYAKMKMREKDS